MELRLREGPHPYLEVGRGRPVVLLHGIFGSIHNWEGFLRHAPEGFRFIVPAIPIFTLPLEQCTIPGLSGYVADLLLRLGLKQVVLGGNSLGGHLALDVALARPEMVDALILTGSSGLFERGFDSGVPIRPGDDWVRAKAMEVFYGPDAVTDDIVDGVRAVVEDRAQLLRAIRTAKSAKRTHMGGRLREIAMPTLLLWGRQDRVTPPDVAEEFHAGIPGSKLVYVEECGHAPMIECPAEFARLVGQFLRGLPPASLLSA
jgi:2-hydroxy-6-oxonona-2,4-dienedioate hydrolase